MAKYSVYTKTMASGGTLTAEIDLGGAYKSAYLDIPAMTNAVKFIQAAAETGGTFRRVYHPALNSSTIGANVFAVVSTATNCLMPIPDGLQYVKVETEIAIADGCVFKVIVGE